MILIHMCNMNTGRPFARIDGIEGRMPEILHFPTLTGDKRAVHPLVFHQVMDTLPVSEWQVAQERDGLQVFLSGASSELNEETLIDSLQQALASQGVIVSPIRIQRVDSIPRNASGKAPLIISHVSATT